MRRITVNIPENVYQRIVNLCNSGVFLNVCEAIRFITMRACDEIYELLSDKLPECNLEEEINNNKVDYPKYAKEDTKGARTVIIQTKMPAFLRDEVRRYAKEYYKGNISMAIRDFIVQGLWRWWKKHDKSSDSNM